MQASAENLQVEMIPGHYECIEQGSKANHPVNFVNYTIEHAGSFEIHMPYIVLDHVGGSLVGHTWEIFAIP